jgi:hypothetical protein
LNRWGGGCGIDGGREGRKKEKQNLRIEKWRKISKMKKEKKGEGYRGK